MKLSSRKYSFGRTLALVLAASATGSVAQAASGIWKGLGADGSWSDTANWSSVPGGVGTTNNGDTATFNIAATANLPVLVDAGRNLRYFKFDTDAGSFTIGQTSGNALHFTSGGNIFFPPAVTGSNLTETINAPLILEAASATTDGSFLLLNSSADASNTLLFGGAIQGGATTGIVTLSLRGVNTGNNTVSGAIGDGNAASGLVVTKTDAGTWTLSGSNSYSGGTTVFLGQLNLNHAHALGTGSLKITGSPGTIDNTSGAPVTLAGYGGLILDNTLNFLGTNDLSLGTAGITVSGARGINVAAGTLTVGGNLSDGGVANKGLSVTGAGVLVLTGNNSGYMEATTITGGLLRLGSATAVPGGRLLLRSGGVLELTAASGDFASTLGTGAGQVGFANAGGGGFSAYDADRAVSLGSSVTWGIGQWYSTAALVLSSTRAQATIDFQSNIDLNNTGGADLTRTIVVNDGSADVDARISGTMSNSNRAGSLFKDGGGTLLLTAQNTYRGATLVNAGRLIVGSTGTLGNTSGITVEAGAVFQYENNTTGLGKAVSFGATGGTFIYNSPAAYTGGTVTVGDGAVLAGGGLLGAVVLDAGGTISPGSSIGALHLDDQSLTWNGESAPGIGQLAFELSLTDNSSDRLDLGTGQLIKGTGARFTFDFLGTGGYFTYTLMEFGSVDGFSMADFSYTNLADGLTGTFVLNPGNLQFQVVPEPGSVGLALIGALGMACAFSKRRHARR